MPPPAPLFTSPKPYLIRAWHEWMSDNGLTPHILVMVDATVSVPRDYVRNNEVVLNVSSEATGGLQLGNEVIRFQARFAGRVRDIEVPVDRVASIFARENGQGMVFEALVTGEDGAWEAHDDASPVTSPEPPNRSPAASGLTLVDKADRDDAAAPTGRDRADQPDDEPPPPSTPKGGGLKVVK